jgi:hypothetical protein
LRRSIRIQGLKKSKNQENLMVVHENSTSNVEFSWGRAFGGGDFHKKPFGIKLRCREQVFCFGSVPFLDGS